MKKSVYLTFIFTILFSLSSYGAPSPSPSPSPSQSQSQSPYNLKYEFYTDKNYQYAYRLVLKNADACSSQGVISKQVADGQLYNELNAGDISISLIAPFGKYTHIRVNFKVEDGKTKVTVSNDFKEWDGLAKAIQDWVTNETSLCK
jgi:hypothetical protein